ncbi:MAG: ABC transporter permease [Oscillospiraceae bacterium]|nr:ABC transporter permease [Oscillospiraceae bacterium]
MIKKLMSSEISYLIIILFVLCLSLSFLTPHFFTVSNLFQVSGQMVPLGLLTIAATAVIISGGFDLSTGALGSLCTVLLAKFIGEMDVPIWASLIIVLAIALFFGSVNGFLCGYLKITPMLVTLGMTALLEGLALGIAKSGVVLIMKPEYFFGQLKIGGVVPFEFLVLIVLAFAAVILLNHTCWGRKLYMMGGNITAANFAGINTPKNIFSVYVFSAFYSFVAAVIISSRLQSGKSKLLDSMVLQSVTAAVFGGVSIKGGRGNIIGVLIGVVTFAIIPNGLNLLEVAQFWQPVIQAGILLLVLTINIRREERN